MFNEATMAVVFGLCGIAIGYSGRVIIAERIAATSKDLAEWHAKLNDILVETDITRLKSKAAILKENIRARMATLEGDLKSVL